MTIGPDIQEALDELGVSTLIRVYDPVSKSFSFSKSERIFYKINNQATRPFIREVFVDGQVGYQSSIKSGTIIKIHNIPYLATSCTPIYFEDEVIQYNVIFYKCNVSGEIQRLSGESNWDRTTMRKNPSFVTQYADVYALLAETDIRVNEIILPPIGDKTEINHYLYLDNFYKIQEKDRYLARSGEYYKVNVVFRNIFEGVDLAVLSNDTR
jgi:hypothetical protein